MGYTTLPNALLGASCGEPIMATRAATAIVTPSDMTMGAPDAPITLIWYASSTSDHCGRWYDEVFPEIRRRYIETGRVRLVLLEFVTPPRPLAEDCFLLARAAGPSRYFRVLEKTFEKISDLLICDEINYHEILWNIGDASGVSRSALAAVFFNVRARKALRERDYRHSYSDRVNAVPSFIVGGRCFIEGFEGIEMFVSAIEEAEREILDYKPGVGVI